jgi:streptomycin 3"-adenylyltransferase
VSQYGWHDCPAPVRIQVEQFVREIQVQLTEQLVGIYLHGSLAMGCFNPDRSDLDLLVITHAGMSVQVKRNIAELLLHLSKSPAPIEVSFLRRTDMILWHYPTPFDFHYSEMWRSAYERDLATAGWQGWNTVQRQDPDLAAHITILNHRGVCLYGTAIANVFPLVPRHDYIASLWYDVSDALTTIADNSVYTVLNICRTYAYLREGHIFSKDEGGIWALDSLPWQFLDVVATALTMYRNNHAERTFMPEALRAFAAYMRTELTHFVPATYEA